MSTPKSFQVLGSICLIKTRNKDAAKTILQQHPNIKSVYFQEKISGKLRTPTVHWLAGDKNTVTQVKENHCIFALDISKVMFSKGNFFEKQRIVSLIKQDETVVDMFAGIGYFAIPIAKLAKPKVVYAIELNPIAFKFLDENIRLNKVRNKIIPIQGDCKRVAQRLSKVADRVLMGWFPGTYEFLPAALKIARKGAVIHFHEVAKGHESIKKKVWEIAAKEGYNLKLLNSRKVKDYGVRLWHWVLDLKVL